MGGILAEGIGESLGLPSWIMDPRVHRQQHRRREQRPHVRRQGHHRQRRIERPHVRRQGHHRQRRDPEHRSQGGGPHQAPGGGGQGHRQGRGGPSGATQAGRDQQGPQGLGVSERGGQGRQGQGPEGGRTGQGGPGEAQETGRGGQGRQGLGHQRRRGSRHHRRVRAGQAGRLPVRADGRRWCRAQGAGSLRVPDRQGRQGPWYGSPWCHHRRGHRARGVRRPSPNVGQFQGPGVAQVPA